MPDELRLRECPFCNKSCAEICTCHELEDCANFESCDTGVYYSVTCSFNIDGCGASAGYFTAKEKAVEAWNRRAGEEKADATTTN